MLYFLSFIMLLGYLENAVVSPVIQTSSATVRLLNGTDACSGRVELYTDNWGTICDKWMNNAVANMICLEAGCANLVSLQPGAFFGQGSGSILTDNLNCTGNESSVFECEWKNHTDACNHNNDAGVICEPPMRFQDGSDTCSGRVEVFHNSQWGTVCDSTWDLVDALVACKQRGCGIPVDFNSFFGAGSGQIWMDGIRCRGFETSLKDCVFRGWGASTTCTHANDAGVTCSVVRLADGPNPCSGRVDVVSDSSGWGTVNYDGWNLLGGDVICRQMSCGSALSITDGSVFTRGMGKVWMFDTTCTGNETSLKSCILNEATRFSHNNDAGVMCREVKLVNGPNICSGTVQVRYTGDWGTVCQNNWDQLDGLVLCRELGCGPLIATYNSSYFGNGSGNILMDDLQCTGSESSLSACQSSSVNSLCSHSQDAGVSCGVIRLVGGDSSCSGRVEILRYNQWGTVCGDGFDMTDAAVLCSELGCGTPVEVNIGGFGEGIGPIWLDDVKCTGTESTLMDCQSNGWGINNCVHANDVGVVCREVRLVNTDNPCEGTVQVLHDGRWGTVCHNSWDIPEGLVLCRELGCGGNVEPLSGAYFGAGDGPIWMDTLRCNGDESNLRKCQFEGWGALSCIHAYDAGIICKDIINVLRIKVNTVSDPNNPTLMTQLLNKIKQEVRKNGNFSVKWRTQMNGQVFQEKKLFDP